MKTTWVLVLLCAVCLLPGCATYSSREQRAVVGIAIGLVLMGSAVHGSHDDRRLAR